MPAEQILAEVARRWGKWKMLAVHYLFKDLFWRRKHEPVPWLEELIRLWEGAVRQILLATRNQTKLLLLGPALEQHGFEVLTLRDLPGAGPDVQESGRTPLENARAKARHYHAPAHPWVLGQDAGLEIDALGGEPGVQVRRWGGRFPDDVDDQTWLAYLLERMRGVPPERRTARFIVARVLIAPDGSEHELVIHYPFRIAAEPLRPIPPGAPISAVMVGPADLIRFRAQEVVRQFEEWGVLAELVRRFPA